MINVQAQRKLRMGRVKMAVAFPFRNFPLLIKLGFFPGLIALVAMYLVMNAHWPLAKPPASIEEAQTHFHATQSGMLVASIAIFIVATMYFVGIIRFIVCNDRPEWILFRLRRYELSYAVVAGIFTGLSFVLDDLVVFIFQITRGFSAGTHLSTSKIYSFTPRTRRQWIS